jgi:hypothetical protein
MRVAHLRHDRKEGWRARVRKDNRGYSSDCLLECRRGEELVVGPPGNISWRRGRLVLNANGDRNHENYRSDQTVLIAQEGAAYWR